MFFTRHGGADIKTLPYDETETYLHKPALSTALTDTFFSYYSPHVHTTAYTSRCGVFFLEFNGS